MTVEKVMSLQSHDLSSVDRLNRYFDDIEENRPIFIAVLVDMNQKVHVYFETKEDASLCKIFFTIEDVQLYIKHLVNTTALDGTMMRYWETTPDDFMKFLNGTGANHAASKNRTLTALSTTILNDKIVTMDVFWSNDQRLMV